MNTDERLYFLVEAKANQIELELKQLGWWQNDPLPTEKFEDMGAFGSNTMTFEQWLQFILIPRIKSIVREKDEFPKSSMLGTYALRIFGGDYSAGKLHNLLYELDDLINDKPDGAIQHRVEAVKESSRATTNKIQTVTLGDTTIPDVLFVLAKALPQFEGDDLESQLQTFDIFLNILSPTVRPQISAVLREAANQTSNAQTKQRIEAAANAVEQNRKITF